MLKIINDKKEEDIVLFSIRMWLSPNVELILIHRFGPLSPTVELILIHRFVPLRFHSTQDEAPIRNWNWSLKLQKEMTPSTWLKPGMSYREMLWRVHIIVLIKNRCGSSFKRRNGHSKDISNDTGLYEHNVVVVYLFFCLLKRICPSTFLYWTSYGSRM